MTELLADVLSETWFVLASLLIVAGALRLEGIYQRNQQRREARQAEIAARRRATLRALEQIREINDARNARALAEMTARNQSENMEAAA